MAALYLHNSIFAQHSSDASVPASTDIYTPRHERHRSTQSSVTITPSFRTSTSEFSHPTEPLLHPGNSASVTYADLLSRQPTHPKGPTPGWDMGLSLATDEPTLNERRYMWELAVKKRLRILRHAKGAMELTMGSWAIYNTVRYFIAFSSYKSYPAQILALVLGTCTTLSVALLVIAVLIASFDLLLISQRVSGRALHHTRTVLRYFASFFIAGPAIASFALVFIWRHATDPTLRFSGRCHWDIDVVWSGPSSLCEYGAPTWGVWLAASSIRLALTLIFIAIYHHTSRAYSLTRRPSQLPSSRRRNSNFYMPSYAVAQPSALPPIFQTVMSANESQSSSPVSLKLNQRHSASTLVEPQTRIRKNDADRKSLRSTRSRNGSLLNPSSSGHASSEADTAVGSESRGVSSINTLSASISPISPLDPHGEPSDTDTIGFVDRFRSLVSQVGREVDEGLEFAQRDHQPNDHYPPSSYHDPLAQPLSAEALDRFNYDEFGNGSHVNDHVLVLGGYIRRMPTIESLGSREIGSLASSVRGPRDSAFIPSNYSGSAHALSLAPTNTLASSEGASRNSSLHASGGHDTSSSYHTPAGGTPPLVNNNSGHQTRYPIGSE